LKQALDLAPDRLDIRGGMAFICQETGRFDEELDILKALVKQALARPDGQRWLKGEALDKPADQFVAEKLHAYASYYYRKETPDDDKRFGTIARLTVDNYPNSPVGWNDLALFHYIGEKDPKKAAECLEKAAVIDPSDRVVKFNLAKFYVDLNEREKARTIYEDIVKNSKSQDDVRDAKEELAQLGKKPPEAGTPKKTAPEKPVPKKKK